MPATQRKKRSTQPRAPRSRATIVGPESFIADAAQPLMKVIDELGQYPHAEQHVRKARKHVEAALLCLDDAYAALR